MTGWVCLVLVSQMTYQWALNVLSTSSVLTTATIGLATDYLSTAANLPLAGQ